MSFGRPTTKFEIDLNDPSVCLEKLKYECSHEKIKKNKTWSSVSNSSLGRPRFWSKTNLCFKKLFGSKQFVSVPKFWPKNEYLFQQRLYVQEAQKGLSYFAALEDEFRKILIT